MVPQKMMMPPEMTVQNLHQRRLLVCSCHGTSSFRTNNTRKHIITLPRCHPEGPSRQQVSNLFQPGWRINKSCRPERHERQLWTHEAEAAQVSTNPFDLR